MFFLVKLRLLAARNKRIRSLERNKKRIVILPASTLGNLGDSAMVLGLLEILQNGGTKKITLFDYNANESWCEELGLESEGMLPNTYKDYKAWSICLSEIERIYINGADVLDGKYSLERSMQRLRLAYFVAHAGTPVTITGFSMRADPTDDIARMFRRLPRSVRLCSRDPVSFHRVRSMTACEVKQVADLAFLMQPSLTSDYEHLMCFRIQSEIEKGRHPIGICLNLHSVQFIDFDINARVEWLMSCMIKVLSELASFDLDYFPVFIPHDYRGEWNDVRLHKLLVSRCEFIDEDYLLIDKNITAPAIKEICSKFDVLITGRMHCGIAALGVGVPTVFFDYQGKVKGLAELFSLTSVIEAQKDSILTATEIIEHVRAFMLDDLFWRGEIKKSLPRVLDLSKGNVDRLDGRQ